MSNTNTLRMTLDNMSLSMQPIVKNMVNVEEDVLKSVLAFLQKRHIEQIEGSKAMTQPWRMKERMKTVSVALVLCLNVGVDPPDVVKYQPCARLECWLDPLAMGPQKALESVGANMQRQYERWQPRARYKQTLDPCVEEVKKLCTSLRRNAKDERVLFHYNGHGVPKPTVNGEIWVFNKTYTQYIPLSIYDLQTWMGSPSIYVYDCSNAGIIVESFKQFCVQREQELQAAQAQLKSGTQRVPAAVQIPLSPIPTTSNCIQLAACSATELLPMNPELPADLFTACLTTPIKIALRWYVLQNTRKLVPHISLELIEKIPGQLNDRRTMLGELNWIFTAITDTIAWNTLKRDVFQKLFRQDLLVASLFRNFLLSERIMRSYNCTPVSSPKLPVMCQHPMWQAWDLALDLSLSQLPGILNEGKPFKHSMFFAEQLTAFQVWLSYGSVERSPPEQLPIVLQVLLSQVHRLRALDLLGKFLDLGPRAVNLALSVGIFPYVLKLLQSSARELRPLLVFIWAKILAVDDSCQTDLVKDNGHKYFVAVLSDPCMSATNRTMAAFVLAMIVNNYPSGQQAAMQGNLISDCLEQLNDPHDDLRQWLAICLAKVWSNFDAARWCGVRDSAHEKLYTLLSDRVPEVRAAAVHALGTFICNSTERTDQANNIDHGVARTLIGCAQDASPLVRKEIVVAFGGMVQLFETQFVAVAYQLAEEDKHRLPSHQHSSLVIIQAEDKRGMGHRRASDAVGMAYSPTHDPGGMRRSMSQRSLKGMLSPSHSSNLTTINASSQEGLAVLNGQTSMKRVASSSSVSGLLGGTLTSVYGSVYKTLIQFAHDPCPEVAQMSMTLIRHLRVMAVKAALPKAVVINHSRNNSTSITNSSSHSAPNSPQTRQSIDIQKKLQDHKAMQSSTREVSIESTSCSSTRVTSSPLSQAAAKSRKISSRSTTSHHEESADDESGRGAASTALVSTQYFQWSCKRLAQPVNRLAEINDPESRIHHERKYRSLRANNLKETALATLTSPMRVNVRLSDQVFVNKNPAAPTVLKFHPFEPHLAVADKETISIWQWEVGTRIHAFSNMNPRSCKITCMSFINTQDKALLMTGTDDGAVRLWRNYCGENRQNTELVTAWKALSDMLPLYRGSGMVMAWEQSTATVFTSGDVKLIRLWDAHREIQIQDIPTGAESCVTSLNCDPSGGHLIVAGCGDGSVRLFDRRLPPNDSNVLTYREHNGWIVNAHMRPGGDKIITADASGSVKFWSNASSESLSTLPMGTPLTTMAVHENADILAVGSTQQYLSVLNEEGTTLSTIKYHEGFMGQRIGPISCMAFHPYKLKLAAGSTDSFMSVYSAPDNKRR